MDKESSHVMLADPVERGASCDEANESDNLAIQREIEEFRDMVQECFAEQRRLLVELIRALPPVPATSSRAPRQRGDPSPSVPTLGKCRSSEQVDQLLHSYGFPELPQPRHSHRSPRVSEATRSKRLSETSLLSLESAPDRSPQADLLRSPSSAAQASQADEILRAISSPKARSQGLEEAHGTETFVTSQIHRQQQEAVAVARIHSERRMSTLVPYTSHRSDSKSMSRRAERLTSSPLFTYGIMSVILTNMILLGVEVDVTSRLPQNQVPPWFVLANAAVVLIFVVELCLLFISSGCRAFFCGPDRSWNIFDFIIIAWSVLETSIELWALSVATTEAQVSASHLRFVRTMRLVRAFRGVRVVRLLRYISALRTLVLSIISSMASLCWTLALLVLLFYSFGIVFTQLVMDYCRDEAVRVSRDINAVPVCPNNVDVYWSSVPESMLTLFTAITGGMNWEDAMVPLRTISPLAASCFIFYVAIAMLAVVNVVTGVFCSTAMESASADKEIATMKQLQKKNAQVADLRRVFEEIVDVESNLVNLQEFQNALLLPRFANFLESMGISTEDIAILFTVMDSDRSGLIDLDEFVQGCLQLHGPAKSLQIAKMSFENKITRQAIKAIGGAMVELREQLDEKLDALCSRITRFCI